MKKNEVHAAHGHGGASVIKFAALVAGSAIAAFMVGRVTHPEFDQLGRIAQIGVFVLAAIVLKFWLWRDTREVVLVIVSILTFTIYMTPMLQSAFIYQPTYRFSYEDLVPAAWYSLFGMCAIAVGYYVAKRLRVPPLLTNVGRRSIPPKRLALISMVLMVFAALSIVYRDVIVGLEDTLGRVLFLVDELPLVAIAVGGLAIIEGYNNWFFKVLLVGIFVPLEILVIIARTLFAYLVIFFMPVLIMYMLRRRRIPFIPVVVAGLLLYPAFKQKQTPRVQRGFSDDRGPATLVADGYSDYLAAWQPADPNLEAMHDEQTGARLNSVALLAHTVRAHEGEGKPFKHGSTFWWLPLAPIPRVIFPAKPQSDQGASFPEEYGLKEPQEHYSLLLPLLVESYINGGLIGVLLINFFIGMAYFAISAAFEHGRGTMNMIALMTTLSFGIYIEDNITLVFGAAIQAMALWWFMDRFVARRTRAREKALSIRTVTPQLGGTA